MTKQPAEQKELETSLAHLQEEAAQQELDLETFKSELRRFEFRFMRMLGPSYAKLDRLRARLAELRAKQNPTDQDAQADFEAARAQSEETDRAQEGIDQTIEIPPKFQAPGELKKLFRELARKVHADLAVDDADRARRKRFMKEQNAAYEAGDENRMRLLMADWEDLGGEATDTELLERLRLRIAGLEKRLQAIEEEMILTKTSRLWRLKEQVEQEEEDGRDLLADIKTAVEQEIAQAKEELEALS